MINNLNLTHQNYTANIKVLEFKREKQGILKTDEQREMFEN